MSKVIRSVTAKFNADISDFDKKMSSMSKQFKKAGEEWKKAGTAMTKGITVPVIAAATAITALAIKAGQYAEKISIAAQTTGMGVEKLQELRYVASQVDVEFETLTGSFAKFTRTLAQAQKPGTEQAKLFDQLGIKMKNADGSLRSLNDLYFDSIKALGGMTNETDQAIAASTLFGRSFQELIPLIKTSSAQLEVLKKRAKELNLVRSPEEIASLAAFDDKIAEIKLRFEGAGQTIALKFLPVMDKLVTLLDTKVFPTIEKVTDAVVKMVDKFSGMSSAQQDFALFGTAVVLAAGPVITAIGGITKAVGTLVGSAGFKALATMLGGGAVTAGSIAGLVGLAAVGTGVAYVATNAASEKFKYGQQNPLDWGQPGYGKNPSGTMNTSGIADPFANLQQKPSSMSANEFIRQSLSVSPQASAQNIVDLKRQSDWDKSIKAYTDGTQKASTSADVFKSSILSMVDAIKEQTKAFFSLANVFDIVDTKVVSGDRLFIRLQKRIKAMMDWRSNLAILEKKGVSKENLNELRGMGPGAGGEIAGLAQLSSSKLGEYFAGVNKLQGIAGGEASKFVTTAEQIGTKIEKQVNIYATGAKGDAVAIADMIVKKLRVAGYRI